MTSTAASLAELEAGLSADALTTEPAAVEKYRRDWTQSDAAGMPLGVVDSVTAKSPMVTDAR